MHFRKLCYYLRCRCFFKEKIDIEMKNKNDDDVSNDDITLDISEKKDDEWQQL